MQTFEPIAAISTPYGRGGIALIRLSGDNAINMACKIFAPKSGKKLTDICHGQAVYGEILYNGKRIDDGIATVFYGPKSYTGEDTVEISCHGGIILAENVLSSALGAGFRHALGGEFTKRAFLNGKISLSQAEAVIGLIDAESQEQLKLSASLTSGVLSKSIDELCNDISDVLASVYAYIDYPDEDLAYLDICSLTSKCKEVLSKLNKLLSSYKSGRAVNEGIKTVIIGKPNAGKSSILNRLVGHDRAIVTSIPGTTRDTVEENVNVGRVRLRLCDTAGIRESDDEVEKLGIQRSLDKLNEADLIIAAFDSSSAFDDLDSEIVKLVKSSHAEVVAVLNKSDSVKFDYELPFETVSVSAKTGDGFNELEEYISRLYVEEKLDYDVSPVISNARQFAAVLSAVEYVQSAISALESGFTQDIAGMDLELCLGKLKELDGKNVSEEITDRIFSRFCVGK